MQVAAMNSRKLVLLPLESSQVSHARAKYTMAWETSYLQSIGISLHTKPLIDLFKDNKFYVLVLKVPDGFVQDFVILEDGSQPELSSVLL